MAWKARNLDGSWVRGGGADRHAGVYFGWLKPAGYLLAFEQQATAKVRDLGLDRLWKYAATGVFYALAHSLLEEYYWRWFVFGQLHRAVL